MPLFYTGKGDKGTSVIGKSKVPKDSQVVEALGDLDELNSLIGLCKSSLRAKPLFTKLTKVQQTLFIIQARIAWILYPKFSSPQVSREKVRELERYIERAEKAIRPKRGFVISGSDTKAAWLDYVRTVARRAERKVFSLTRNHKIPEEILAYLNRLSSYLYALARFEAHKRKLKEPRPTYR